jgi:type I restriction enzyme S subunit
MTLNLDKSAWETVRFGDVVKNVNETVRDAAGAGIDRAIGLEHLDPGELKIVRWSNDPSGTTFTKRVRPGQTLFGKRRAYQRKAAYAEFDAMTSGDVLAFEAIPERLLNELLPFIVQSEPFCAYAVETSAGSLSPRTSWGDLAKFEFALPSFDEQRRLADLLWAAEHHRRSLDGAVEALHVACDEWLSSELGTIPTRPLQELASLQHGKPVASSNYGAGDLVLLRPGDIPPTGTTQWSMTTVRIPADLGAASPAQMLAAGDLVINMTAQSLDDRFLGRVARVHEEAFLNQRIGKLTPNDGIDGRALFLALRSRTFTDWVALRSEGSKVKHMHWRHIADFPTPAPDNIQTAALASGQAGWENALATCERELATVTAVSHSVLHEVFR